MIDLIKLDAAKEARETFPHLFAEAYAFALAQRMQRAKVWSAEVDAFGERVDAFADRIDRAINAIDKAKEASNGRSR